MSRKSILPTRPMTPALLDKIEQLQAALREACDWADCESGEGIVEQRAAVVRLRTLAGE
jgi:hypothetical protein